MTSVKIHRTAFLQDLVDGKGLWIRINTKQKRAFLSQSVPV